MKIIFNIILNHQSSSLLISMWCRKLSSWNRENHNCSDNQSIESAGCTEAAVGYVFVFVTPLKRLAPTLTDMFLRTYSTVWMYKPARMAYSVSGTQKRNRKQPLYSQQIRCSEENNISFLWDVKITRFSHSTTTTKVMASCHSQLKMLKANEFWKKNSNYLIWFQWLYPK